MKKLIFAGNVPYLAVALLALSFFYFGFAVANKNAKPIPKIAFAEKGALVLSNVLARQDISESTLDEQIKKPILAVMKRYVDQGYVVIDSSRDENGNMAINAIPPGAIDITSEMKEAINKASNKTAPSVVPAAPTATPSAGSKP
jgi:hypothetical protein